MFLRTNIHGLGFPADHLNDSCRRLQTRGGYQQRLPQGCGLGFGGVGEPTPAPGRAGPLGARWARGRKKGRPARLDPRRSTVGALPSSPVPSSEKRPLQSEDPSRSWQPPGRSPGSVLQRWRLWCWPHSSRDPACDRLSPRHLEFSAFQGGGQLCPSCLGGEPHSKRAERARRKGKGTETETRRGGREGEAQSEAGPAPGPGGPAHLQQVLLLLPLPGPSVPGLSPMPPFRLLSHPVSTFALGSPFGFTRFC